MAEAGVRKQEISLKGEIDAVVRYGATLVELHPGGDLLVRTEGHAIVHSSGDIDVHTDASVRVHPANDNGKSMLATSLVLKPGDRVADGTVYAGRSPETKSLMYTTPT